jgi:hypothetical protein
LIRNHGAQFEQLRASEQPQQMSDLFGNSDGDTLVLPDG